MAQRRTKIEVLNEKISKVDSKIAACTEKIAVQIRYETCGRSLVL